MRKFKWEQGQTVILKGDGPYDIRHSFETTSRVTQAMKNRLAAEHGASVIVIHKGGHSTDAFGGNFSSLTRTRTYRKSGEKWYLDRETTFKNNR